MSPIHIYTVGTVDIDDIYIFINRCMVGIIAKIALNRKDLINAVFPYMQQLLEIQSHYT
jgi:hypothetical protein